MNNSENLGKNIAVIITPQLGELDQVLIDDYHIFLLVAKNHSVRKNVSMIIKSGLGMEKGVSEIIATLLGNGILTRDKDIDSVSVYSILGKNTNDPHEVICSVDPFAYISHLSAMAYHGLTDRRPNTVYFTRPGQKDWRAFAEQKMAKDYAGIAEAYKSGGFPRLKKVRFEKVRGYPVIEYASLHPGAFKSIQGRKLRVSTIGRTFLDMVRKPAFCGGMRHVMEVYKRFGEQYSNLIIDEIERHGKKIEKVRAGYLLEEISGVKGNPVVETWLSAVQRGGSRKLDPESEYNAEYSERWCLSLNA